MYQEQWRRAPLCVFITDQRVTKEQACCRLHSVIATLAANPCHHREYSTSKTEAWIRVIDMCSACTKSSINIESEGAALLCEGQTKSKPTLQHKRKSQQWRGVKFVVKLQIWAVLQWQRMETWSLWYCTLKITLSYLQCDFPNFPLRIKVSSLLKWLRALLRSDNKKTLFILVYTLRVSEYPKLLVDVKLQLFLCFSNLMFQKSCFYLCPLCENQ